MTASEATNTALICARFSEPSEWASEIIHDRDLVERQIARVTKTARPVMDGAATRAHVVAARSSRAGSSCSRRASAISGGWPPTRKCRSARAGSSASSSTSWTPPASRCAGGSGSARERTRLVLARAGVAAATRPPRPEAHRGQRAPRRPARRGDRRLGNRPRKSEANAAAVRRAARQPPARGDRPSPAQRASSREASPNQRVGQPPPRARWRRHRQRRARAELIADVRRRLAALAGRG